MEEALIETLPVWFWILISIITVWSSIWKGFALWKSARKRHIVWFIVLLILNTVGILEILYIFVFSNCCKKKQEQESKKRKK